MSRQMVKLELIEVSESSLRGAQTQTAEFEELKASIASDGIFNNLLVAKSDTAEGMYILIDGLQRFTIAGLLGIEEVPVNILPANEKKKLMIQMQANLHTLPTKPAEYAKQLIRILRLQDMSVNELAKQISKSPEWINARLGLMKLHPKIQELVDNGSINLSNARVLSNMNEEDQKNWLTRAMNDPADIFVPAAKEHLAAVKKAEREGNTSVAEVFVAVPRQRSKSEMLAEAEKPLARNTILTKDMTPAQAWVAAIQWSLRLDPQTVKESEEKWIEAKAARDARKVENAKAREAAKAAKAAEIEAVLV